MNKKELCQNFIKGNCLYGDKCKFSHEIPSDKIIIPKSCKYFLENRCRNKIEKCQFFHGFGGCLLYYKTIKGNKEIINNLVKMDDSKYISSDDKSFVVLFMKNDQKTEKSLEKEGFKIGKMIYSSDKVIFALRREGK